MLLRLERFDAAADHCRRALQIHARSAVLHQVLGVALAELRHLEAAAVAYRRAAALVPASPSFRVGFYWHVLRGLGRTAEAERELRAAAARDERSAAPGAALADLLVNQGRLEPALAACAEALAREPDHAGARFQRARANFLAGDYAAAWPDYASRRRLPAWRGPQVTARAWEGEDLAGRSILLYGEQGLGDAIQFARYAPLVARRGAEVLLYCSPRLVTLLRRLPAGRRRGARRPPPAAHRPGLLAHGRTRHLGYGRRLDPGRLSLPARAHPAASVAAAGPAVPGRHRLGGEAHERPGPPGAPAASTTSRRSSSCPAPSSSASRSAPRAAELRTSGWYGLIREAPPAAVPFDATADALTEVDIVVTVDTVLAHLAGAVGRPVWTLLSFVSDWRWMLGRTDTPWYPTMRLFRQPALDDWASVFREVRAALAARVAQAAR